MLFKHIMTDEVEDSFQAFLVDGAEFTDIEEYPILTEDMVPSVLPEKKCISPRRLPIKGI